MAKEPKIVDWTQVEKDYRAGIKSNRQMAEEQGVSETAIRKKAKALDWKKDLSAKIRLRAMELVRTQEVRSEVRTEIDDSQIIEDNAKLQAEIVLSHRKDIRSKRALVEYLTAELQDETINGEAYITLKEMLADSENADQAKLEEAFRRATSLPTRIDSVKKIAETLKTLIALEREAFNLDAEDKTPPANTDIDSVNAKLAELLEKANA